MSAKTIRIDQANRSVTFPETTVIDELVVELFDREASDERHELYDRVLRAGSYAYLEDRIGSFLATTATTIGAEFEYLKMLFNARQHSMATAEKGEIGEDSVLTELTVLSESARIVSNRAATVSNSDGLFMNGTVPLPVG
jgi:hypothetical protein